MYFSVLNNPIIRADFYVDDEGILKIKLGGVAPKLIKPLSQLSSLLDGSKPIEIHSDKLLLSTWMPPIPSPAFKRFVWNQVKALLHNYYPDMVTICVTDSCPNKCKHCAIPATGRNLMLEPELCKSRILPLPF